MTTTASFPASYPLGTLREYPSEWMLDLMVDLYQGQIRGSHGFGLTHPRARWLRLVVSDTEECPCGDLGRWEDDTERGGYGPILWCSRCAEAEIALLAAEQLRRAAAVPHPVPAYGTEPTIVEPFVPMAQLPRAGALLCALALAVLSMASGCATSRPVAAAAPETVGTLAPSYASIAVAPVHHDAPPELGGVAGTDDDEPTATSLDVLRGEAAASGAVDVAPKTDGVTTGAAR